MGLHRAKLTRRARKILFVLICPCCSKCVNVKTCKIKTGLLFTKNVTQPGFTEKETWGRAQCLHLLPIVPFAVSAKTHNAVFPRIRIKLTFRDNAFEVMLASQAKQSEPVSFNVVTVQEAVASDWHHATQPALAFNQRQSPQIFSVIPKNVECDKPGFPSPEQQIPEVGFTVAVEAHDFTV